MKDTSQMTRKQLASYSYDQGSLMMAHLVIKHLQNHHPKNIEHSLEKFIAQQKSKGVELDHQPAKN
jgi:hypothetical protein